MTTPQDKIANIAKQGQEAVTGAMRTWAETVQRLAGQAGGSAPDVSAVVDNAFDLAERLLATQREFTKNMLQALATGVAQDSADSVTADPIGKTAPVGKPGPTPRPKV